MLNRWRLAPLIAIVGGAIAFVPVARAQSGLNIGTLTCLEGAGWGLVLGSARPLRCQFAPDGGPTEQYIGTMWRFGLDLGYTHAGVLIWSVIVPTARLMPHALTGTYAGATASATVGLGVGANGLIGGFFNSIMLQPVSIETNQGLDVSAGIASMTLSPGRWGSG